MSKVKHVSKTLVDVSLTDRYGNPLVLYSYEGRFYVEAKDLEEYRIVVNPKTHSRIEVLSAVDGRNTLLDEEANLQFSRGMVVRGFRNYVIKGWRIDDDHTRPFVFTYVSEETVAAQVTGSTNKLGVIAIATYRERPEEIKFKPFMFNDMLPKDGLESTIYRGEPSGVGTGMGNRLDRDEVGHTTFVRETINPVDVVEIYAKPKWWLVKHGVIREEHDADHPQGFSGSRGATGYDRFDRI